MDDRVEHQTPIMIDEDSRDSGVSVNSNNDHIDLTSSQFTMNTKNEYNIKAYELDKDFLDLKIEEMCMDLDEVESSANELLMKKAAMKKFDNARAPLSDVGNKWHCEEYERYDLNESPKSRKDPSKGLFNTTMLEIVNECSTLCNNSSSTKQMIIGWNQRMLSKQTISSETEDVWCDELNVTMSDASSVFTDDTQSSTSSLTTSLKHVFVRRTQSDGVTSKNEAKIEVRSLSNEDRHSACETPLCVLRAMRKRCHWRLQECAENVAAKKPKAAAADILIDVKETDKVRPRRASAISRALSSGALERGQFAKLRDGELPELLEVSYSLQTVPRPQVDSGAFRSISVETFIELLSNMDDEQFARRFVVIDCRYPYEYQGGHIKGAINIHNPEDIIEFFFPNNTEQFVDISRKIPIFYCEFSQKRGPTMAHALRAHDRKLNEMRYPDVFYKEIYLVDYGYRRFYQLSKLMGLCEPNAYVTMTDTCYLNELRSFHIHRSRSLHSVDQSLCRRSHLSRRSGKISFRCLKSAIDTTNVESSPHDEESPTQFANTTSVKRIEKVEELQLTPLSKLDFS
uniref:M-phase inducer phosphatase n=1 Tax=Parascaris univalens TaxID=6257 RepID=A0A914ZF79_PARUN